MKTTYITRGDVRGRCPHQHRTLSGAERCLHRDAQGCWAQGGYSDRAIYRQEEGRIMSLSAEEQEELAESRGLQE